VQASNKIQPQAQQVGSANNTQVSQTRSKNGSKISMQTVKQIKAEAFKCYLSQATQLQAKILEQSMNMSGSQQVDTLNTDMNNLRPNSQENNSIAVKGQSSRMREALEGNTSPRDLSLLNSFSRSKANEMLPSTDHRSSGGGVQLTVASPTSHKHMTPQVQKTLFAAPPESTEIMTENGTGVNGTNFNNRLSLGR